MTDRKRILVVDDEKYHLELMQGILGDTYEVDCVSDGNSCLEHFEKTPADIVLLDVEMPGMDGLETCRRLLEIESACPVMFISVRGSNEERLAGYEAGGYDYIVKPFEPDELLAKLVLIIQQQEQRRQLAQQQQDIFHAFKEALTGSSELGVLIHFAVTAFEVKTYQQLAEAVGETMKELGNTSASFFVGGQHEEYFWSESGPCSPMDQEIVAMLTEKGRIYEFNNQIQINEKNVSMLLKNMPDDETLKGRYKDNLHFLLKIASACVDHIDTASNLKSKEDLIGTIQNTTEKIFSYENELKDSISQFLTTIEDEFERIENGLQFLALSEEQENNLITSIEKALNAGHQSADNTFEICNRFKGIITELNSLL